MITHENLQILNYDKKDYVTMYGADFMKIRSLWEQGFSGKGIVIAVIDSGIDIKHKNFEDRIIAYKNFTDDDTEENVFDYSGHGTHVAGIISSKNSKAIEIGAAPNAELVILKVIDSNSKGKISSLINSLNYVIEWNEKNDKKINIVNLSLGSAEYSEKLYKTIKLLNQQDVLIVAAAGNYGDSLDHTEERIYPGFFKEVIQIGSIDKDKKISKFNNSNLNIDFVAPGEDIYSTLPGNSFGTANGTSMSAPIVSGGLALLLEKKIAEKINNPSISILNYLRKNTEDLGCSIPEQGNGLITLI